ALPPIPIRIPRHRPLDVVPPIAHRTAGLRPGQARTRAAGFPVALELWHDVFETLAAIPAVGVVAVLVGRLVVAPIAPAGGVRRVLVVGLEVIVVVGGVDRLGDRVARLRADHAADDRADHRADRPGHRTHRRASHRSGDRAGAPPDAAVLLHVAHRTAGP